MGTASTPAMPSASSTNAHSRSPTAGRPKFSSSTSPERFFFFHYPRLTMTTTQNFTVLAGRILLGLIFVLSGFGKIAGFDGTVGYIASQNLPLPSVVAVLTILVELGGGLALVTGFYTRQAALLLTVFTLVAAVIFHAFWAAPEAAKA